MKRISHKLIGLTAIALMHCGESNGPLLNDPNAIRGTQIPTTTFVVRIENVSDIEASVQSTGSPQIPLSPGVFAIHTHESPLFTPNRPASAGIELLAENGAEQTALRELATQKEVLESGRMDTPVGQTARASLFTGEAYEFSVRALAGERLSFATMFVESNDLFYAPLGAGIRLFDNDGNPITGDVTNQVFLWDAGTEVNEQPGVGSNQAPRQSSTEAGIAENGVVRRITEVDDGYQYPAVPQVIRVSLRLAR